MRNRAAVWSWGGLAIVVLGLAVFAVGPVVSFLLEVRAISPEEGVVPVIKETEKERDFGRYVGMSAGVYSKYPFNDRNFIFLNRGAEDEVHLEDPVLGEQGELLGGVREVTRTRAQVETFWSPTWKSAVYVGEKKSKAVLRGGETPILEFLPKDSGVKVGDTIYNASPEFPLYVSIGKVAEVINNDQDPWLGAEVEPLLNLEAVREVCIIKNFP